MAVCQPFRFGGGLRLIGQQAAGDLDVDVLPRQGNGRLGDPGRTSWEGEALLACRRCNGKRHFQREYGAASFGQDRRPLTATGLPRRSQRRQRDKFAVEPCLANQQARRDGNARPSVFQDIDGEDGPAGGEVAVDA